MPATTFGMRLTEHRNHLGFSQQALAAKVGTHPTDLSKIENDKQKPPKVSVVLNLVKALRLSRSEADELLSLAGYDPSVLNATFDPSSYPKAEWDRGEALPQEVNSYSPSLTIAPDGTITAANLLAFSLWAALTNDHPTVDATRLLGSNIFEVYTRPENIRRIAMPEEKSSFWYNQIILYKKMEPSLDIITQNAFRIVLANNVIFSLIHDYADMHIDNEWSYHLKIQQPYTGIMTRHSTYADIKEYLEFKVTVKQLFEVETPNGFIINYQSIGRTSEYIAKERELLLAKYGKDSFIQDLSYNQKQYPPFYPSVRLSSVWDIIDENSAHELLFSKPTKDKHFFDIYFSEREVSITQKAMIETIARFLTLYQKFRIAHLTFHPLKHNAHFIKALNLLWQTPFEPSLSTEISDGDVLFDMHVPSQHDIYLNLTAVINLDNNHSHPYWVTLLPKDKITKAALILNELGYTLTIDIQTSLPINQLKWGHTIIETLKIGLTNKQNDATWDPKESYYLIEDYLTNVGYDERGEVDMVTWIGIQLKLAIIELILQFPDEEKEAVYHLLQKFFAPVPILHDFLATRYVLDDQETGTDDQKSDLPVTRTKALQPLQKSKDQWYSEGEADYKAKRYEKATTAFEQAIILDPNYSNAYYMKGKTLFNLADGIDTASSKPSPHKEHEDALNIEIEELLTMLGLSEKGNSFQKKCYLEALTAFEQVIKLIPDFAGAYYWRGKTFIELEREEEALTDLNHALQLDPTIADAYDRKGSVLRHLHRYKDALKACEDAIQLEPDNPIYYYNKSITLEVLEKHKEAQQAYEIAKQLGYKG